MKKTPTAPRAEYATKPITPTMRAYAYWLKAETGYDVDPMSVQLAGTMRVAFQKSDGNRARLAAATEKATAAATARADRRAVREQAAADKAAGLPVTTTSAKPKAKAAPVKPTTPRRRRPAAPAPVEAVAK